MTQPVFRFAPSPNGRLHLGHAYSALLNQKMAEQTGGKLLLRIEDVDQTRCNPVLEQRMLEDLEWLGLRWNEPPMRQSERIDHYQQAITQLKENALIYPAFMSRREHHEFVEHHTNMGEPWPCDPDGAPLYPQFDKHLSAAEVEQRFEEGAAFSYRLDLEAVVEFLKKPLTFSEAGPGLDGIPQTRGIVKTDLSKWGDVMLWSKDDHASYHIACCLDDAAQNISHVVRGSDLFHATAIHRALQEILGLPEPEYFHHHLILDDLGNKLSKSNKDTSIDDLRRAGYAAKDIRKIVGF